MALDVYTDKPAGLLAMIKKAIDEGRITTWSYDEDGDFTHTPSQWVRKAWLRPHVGDRLRFGLLGPNGNTMTKVVYGVYHGRFVEMLLAHFDTEFEWVSASAMQQSIDTF